MSSGSVRPDEWWFEDWPCGRSNKPGLIQKKTFDRTIETFVREVLQNSTDARVESDEAVEVSFKLREIDEDSQEFDDAICWDSLYKHVEAGGEAQDGHGIEDYVEYLEDDGPFRVLVVEEKNTVGIQGNEEDEDSHYAALVRDPGASNKGGGEGGRHGLGSTLLWVCSGFQTVLFNSTLDEELPDQTSPRLVGRSFIPTHETASGECHDIDGWFGSPTGLEREELQRPESIWDDPAEEVADALGFARPDEPGTSIMVVGFRDPANPAMDDQPTPEEIRDVFESTTAEYFWPAISRGDLEVEIDMCGHEASVTDETIRDYSTVYPFVSAYEERLDAPESFSGPGTVAKVDYPYEIRSKKEESTPEEGHITVAARKAEPSDTEGEVGKRVGEIAMFRGPGMVVKYKPGYHLGHSGKYHAVLAAGEARTPQGESPEPDDEAIDDFLAMAEPPMHNEWYGEKNAELDAEYESGCKGQADAISTRVLRSALSAILYSDSGTPGTVVRPDRDILPRTRSSRARSRKTNGPSRQPLFDWEITEDDIVDNRWVFRGNIDTNYDEATGWDVSFETVGIFEDEREADRIRVAEVEVAGESGTSSGDLDGGPRPDGTGAISASSNVGEISFTIRSEKLPETDPRRGDIGRTRFKIADGAVKVESES